MQERLQFVDDHGMEHRTASRPKGQLLKWIGNKQRFAMEICNKFPTNIRVYREPFLGSGAVLATLAHSKMIGSDVFKPLVEIWQCLASNPDELVSWYQDRWQECQENDARQGYKNILARYNADPNGADLVYLCRSCYGGVVRFRKADGFMSTPCGPHRPISPDSFATRVTEWSERVGDATFKNQDYSVAFAEAEKGDLVYCDPPYVDSQKILYGAQSFSLDALYRLIETATKRGVRVALSIDGSKKSGNHDCEIGIPDGLFAREEKVNVGRSMLKRFQRSGSDVADEVVTDRLLLNY